MNKERLLRVAEEIEKTGRIEMNRWISYFEECVTKDSSTAISFVALEDEFVLSNVIKDSCNTVGCIAGWACALYQEEMDGSIFLSAKIILDLNNLQSDRLFFKRYWPTVWRLKYNEQKIMRDRAKVVSDYIKLFVKVQE